MKKALLLGGTGALGTYLAPSLLEQGFSVDVVSLDTRTSDHPQLHYETANAMELAVATALAERNYDVIVDFMIYQSLQEFVPFYHCYLPRCKQYFFLSSYRVYADSKTPITEESARILDVVDDPAFVKDGEYSIYKAEQENLLRNGTYQNWTILRPAITFSKERFQLATLEAHTLVYRMLRGKTVVLPEPAMEKKAAINWAGNFGKMVARLALNPLAFGEAYTVASAETFTWREVATLYQKIGGLKYITVDTETYLHILSPQNDPRVRQQLTYDRYLNREVDNRKILTHCGLSKEDLTPIAVALEREYQALPRDAAWPDQGINARMDAYLKERGIE